MGLCLELRPTPFVILLSAKHMYERAPSKGTAGPVIYHSRQSAVGRSRCCRVSGNGRREISRRRAGNVAVCV